MNENEEIMGAMEDGQAVDFVLASPILVKEFKKEENKLLCFSDDLSALLAENGCWIAGGAVTSIFTGKEINDIDVYFPSKEAFSNVMGEIYDGGEVSFGDAHICHATNKSLLLQSDGQYVQFIVFKFFDNVQQIFDSFDFTAVMGAYSFSDKTFHFHPDFLKHNAQRFLSFNKGTDYPLISMIRVDKYRERGYSTSKQEMLKIGMAIANKNFDSWEKVIDEVGSFYGLNPNEIFDTTKEFSLSEVISQLDNLFIPVKYKNVDSPHDFFELAKRMPHTMSQIALDYIEANKEKHYWERKKFSEYQNQNKEVEKLLVEL